MPVPKKNKSTHIKSTDGRKNNGRKPGQIVKNTKKQKKLTPAKMNKAKKGRQRLYATNAIIDEFGSEAEFFAFLANKARDSFSHFKLLTDYYAPPEEAGHVPTTKAPPQIVFMGDSQIAQDVKDSIIDVTHEEE